MSASHSSSSRSDNVSGARCTARWTKLRENPSIQSNSRSEVMAPPGTGGRTGLCKNTPIKACENFAGAPKPGRRQSIETATRAARTRWINGFPSADKPSGCFESQQNGIQGPGCEMATLVHFRARQLLSGVFQKCLQHLQGLQGHSHFTLFITHGSKST